MRVYFAWFDFWLGLFWDRKKKILYACPVPCLVIEARSRASQFWVLSLAAIGILCVVVKAVRR